MVFRTVIEDPIPEKVSVQIAALIHDEKNVGIPAANLTTLVFTLYDLASESIINSRTAVNILNTGGGVVDTSGNLTLTLTPNDGVILGTSDLEKHLVLLEWTYNSGSKAGRGEVELSIKNLLKVL